MDIFVRANPIFNVCLQKPNGTKTYAAVGKFSVLFEQYTYMNFQRESFILYGYNGSLSFQLRCVYPINFNNL